MDDLLLGLVTPRDVTLLGGGVVRPRIAQPAVATRGLLLLFRSPHLPLDTAGLASADLLNESFPFRIPLTFRLLTCCRGDGRTRNTILLTTRADEMWRLGIIL